MKLDPKKKLTDLTVAEYLMLGRMENKYAFGIVGIAKIFGCSKSKAHEIKASGDIDDAIFQKERIIVVDIEKALHLFANKTIK